MPYEELIGWSEYLAERPYGWREDQRTMLLLQAAGVKERPEKVFSSLAAIKASSEAKRAMGLVAAEEFKRSSIFHFLSDSQFLPDALK
jgi:hypothetical protein